MKQGQCQLGEAQRLLLLILGQLVRYASVRPTVLISTSMAKDSSEVHCNRFIIAGPLQRSYHSQFIMPVHCSIKAIKLMRPTSRDIMQIQLATLIFQQLYRAFIMRINVL